MKRKLLPVALSFCLAFCTLPVAVFGGCGKGKKSGVFNEKEIVLSFSAMSDIHQQLGKSAIADKLVNALDYSKDLNGGKPLDVALFAGDLTEETWRKQNEQYSSDYNGDIEMLKSTLDRGLNADETAVFYCLGNHDTDPSELGKEYMSQMPALFYSTLGEKYFQFDSKDSMPEIGLRHMEKKGYHFLAVQPDEYWKLRGYSDDTLAWLDAKLAEITKAEPNKYVFVTGHPPIYGTVFGSYANTWADQDVAEILEKYPQAVYFSGHIHNVLQDEVQISQNGYFTALDCGSVKYTEVMNDINDNRTVSFDNDIGTRIDDFSQGLFVEVDKSGNLRVSRVDYYQKKTIKTPWELSYPKADLSHLKTYDNESRIEQNEAPMFESTANCALKKAPSGITFSWDAATDDDMVRYYHINLFKKEGETGTKVAEYNIATHTYRYAQVADMPKEMTFTAEGAFSGEYYFEISAVDIWSKYGAKITSAPVVI